ncbi:MAG: hypothetical protein LBU79_02365 [Planctomycetota bacterium]|jgi:hypothetical protein|nr:hypothetical protein [Planctomycetota bacterium]
MRGKRINLFNAKFDIPELPALTDLVFDHNAPDRDLFVGPGTMYKSAPYSRVKSNKSTKKPRF